MKHILYTIILSFLLVANNVCAEEISLYDNKGEAVAYIDVVDELTIYLWSGKPVAYLDGENIYGFNGKHLGWYSDGAIIDHRGDAPCVLKERFSGFTKFESFKSFKQFKPFKSFKEFAPFKPFESNRLSSEPCSIFLFRGGN